MIFMVDALRQRLSGNPFLLALKQKRLEGKRACRPWCSINLFLIRYSRTLIPFLELLVRECFYIDFKSFLTFESIEI